MENTLPQMTLKKEAVEDWLSSKVAAHFYDFGIQNLVEHCN